MPEGAEGQEMTITALPGVTTEFGVIVFTKEGTYVYEISEENTGIKNYTYDTTVYTVTYNVTKEGTSLVKERIVTVKGEKKDLAVFEFTNEYKKPEDPPKPPVPPEMPKTGDESRMALWISMLSLSSLALCAAVFAKRREEKEA